ncbi:MAG TPA: alpha/beta fold hydrolase, partial [Actinomycetota bacterium]|nr:alpha/beta fold hydrolase [Actinomycetota bacterium]
MAPSRNPSKSARTIAGRFVSDGADAARPVVVVHGLGLSSRYMERFSRALVGVGPVYAVDLPGFGRSFRPEQPLDVPGLADALVAWMRGAGIGPAVLVGNSLGSQVVLDVAVR